MITDSLTLPTLLVDEQQCRENTRAMLARARRHQVRLRPHFKTHQSRTVARWMREEGVEHATVSSLSMARYFAPDWDDITVAFPFNVHEIGVVNALAAKVQLGITVENIEALAVLAEKLTARVQIWVKVDAGYHRTGVPAEQTDRVKMLLQTAAKSRFMNPAGVLIHAGHTYDVQGEARIAAIHQETLAAVTHLREALAPELPDLSYSIGDTPSCSTQEDYSGCTEIRPGNFVFYDMMQHYIGSNSLAQIAVCMACPVVAKHPERNHVVVYGGGVHFSKDQTQNAEGEKVLGLPVPLTESGWGAPFPDSRVVKLSQEHGILEVPNAVFDSLKVGDWVGVLPVHSCLTADLMGEYLSLTGDTVDHLRAHRFPAGV